MLKRHAKDPVSDVTTLDELKDYFAEEGEQGTGDGSEEVNPYGPVKLTARPLPPKKTPAKQTTGNGEDDGDSEGGSGGGGDEGDGGGDGEGGKGDAAGGSGSGAQKPTVLLLNPRAVITAANKRRIAFTASKSGTVDISLFEVGADQDFLIAVRDGNRGTVVDGKLRLSVKGEAREVIEVKLAEEFHGALKVVAHGL